MILAQIKSAGQQTLLYQVPYLNNCLINELIVCNTNNAPHSFSIRIAISDEAKVTKQYICHNRYIEPNGTISIGNSIQLGANDVVYVEDPSNCLVFSLHGTLMQGPGLVMAQKLSDGTSALLYEVSSATKANISKIIVCNTNSSTGLKFSIRLINNGDAPDQKQFIFYERHIAPGETIELPGINIGNNDFIFGEDTSG